MTKKREDAVVLSQESIAKDIYSMWLKTEAASEARPGQFYLYVYKRREQAASQTDQHL